MVKTGIARCRGRGISAFHLISPNLKGRRKSLARITWLHLSDMHVGHGDAAHRLEQQQVLDELVIDAVRMKAELGGQPPDFIFLTGDIAARGERREYNAAAKWFGKLRADLGAEGSSVYVVPGNHDVERNRIDPRSQARHDELWKYPRRIDDLLKSRQDTKETVWRKLGNFARFRIDIGAKPGRPGEVHTRDDVMTAVGRVLIVGLNTALLSRSDEDLGHLCLGQTQIQIVPLHASNAVVFVLQHHPPAWLADHEVDIVEERLSSQPALLLHGHRHKHKPVIKFGLDGRRGIVVIPAGAVHNDLGGVERHAYSWGSLSLEGLTLYPRAYRRAGTGAGEFGVDQDATDAGPSLHVPIDRLPKMLGSRLTVLAQSGVSRGHLPRQQGPVAAFAGRTHELQLLNKAFNGTNTILFEVTASEGSGKTELARRFAEQLVASSAGSSLPPRVFLFSFTAERVRASSSTFFEQFLEGDTSLPTGASPQDRAIAKLQAYPTLLVLDGMEALKFDQRQVGTEKAADTDMESFLKLLMKQRRLENGGLVLVTSREALPGYQRADAFTVQQISLEPLPPEDARSLLQTFRLEGTAAQIAHVVNLCRGQPFVLTLVGGALRRFFGGRARDVGKLLGGENPTPTDVVRRVQDLGKIGEVEMFYLRCVSALGRELQQDELNTLKRVQAAPEKVRGVRDGSRAEDEIRAALVSAGLLRSSEPGTWDTHGTIKQHVDEDTQKNHSDLWCQIHSALFALLSEKHELEAVGRWYGCSSSEQDQETSKLGQLYEAVREGCLVGRYPEAYHILRYHIAEDNRGRSTEVLGKASDDLAHLSLFFDDAAADPASAKFAGELIPDAQAWILARTSYCLECEGHLDRAIGARVRSNALYEQLHEKTDEITQGCEELALLDVYVGDLHAAEDAARASVRHAAEGAARWQAERVPLGSAVRRIASHAALGTVLHRLGRCEEAEAAFGEALAQHHELRDGDINYSSAPEPLHAAPGVRRCELLMDVAASEEDYRAILAAAEAMVAWSEDTVSKPDGGRLEQPLIAGAHRLVRGSALAALGEFERAQADVAAAIDRTNLVKHNTEFGVECLLVSAAIQRRQARRICTLTSTLGDTRSKTAGEQHLSSALEYLAAGEEIAETFGMPLVRADIALVRSAVLLDLHELCSEASTSTKMFGDSEREVKVAEELARTHEYRLREQEISLLHARLAVCAPSARDQSSIVSALRTARRSASRRPNLLLVRELEDLERKVAKRFSL